jgi:hypothetical protein
MSNKTIIIEDVHVLHKMRQFGGSFVRALAEAGFCADSENLAKIKATWPDLWKEYEAWARAAQTMATEARPEAFGDECPPEFERGAM